MKTPNLELYFFPSCPYCHIVLKKIDELNLFVTFKNIHEDSMARDKLYQDTGRFTVPCLYIDKKPMHESRDIIAWMEKNQQSLLKK